MRKAKSIFQGKNEPVWVRPRDDLAWGSGLFRDTGPARPVSRRDTIGRRARALSADLD